MVARPFSNDIEVMACSNLLGACSFQGSDFVARGVGAGANATVTAVADVTSGANADITTCVIEVSVDPAYEVNHHILFRSGLRDECLAAPFMACLVSQRSNHACKIFGGR
jgi:hypothetical protein